MADPVSKITLEVARSIDGATSRFEVPVPQPTNRVLDALLYVRHHLDPSLGFRYSCRAGMCGACAVVVNGKEALACQTTLGSLGTSLVRVAPLRALPVLRDLVCDMTPFFGALEAADAALRPKEADCSTLRTMPPGAEPRALIERHNGCLTCGACHSACERTGTPMGTVGPAAMNRVLMLALDERDRLGKARFARVAQEVEALRGYTLDACSAVCPAEIPLDESRRELERLLAAGNVA